MNALLFAGGFGQRLWPISRKNKPKQFSPLLGSKSFLRLAVDRILPIIPPERIFISTNKRFEAIVADQLKEVPANNLILEPERRDLGAAAALAFFTLSKIGVTGPIYFQWSDNYVGNEEGLRQAIAAGNELIEEGPNRIVFIGQTPRFASENLGWIKHGSNIGSAKGLPYYSFVDWHYRPHRDLCVKMFKSGEYMWNSGFFLTTMEFVLSTFRNAAPDFAAIAEEIADSYGTARFDQTLRALYPKMPVAHFDEMFLMRLKPEQAVILKIDLDWTDPGTLYGLKEALHKNLTENVKKGNVVDIDCIDSLLFNEEDKVLSAMGLDGVMVVNTPDALLVVSKDSVRHLAKLLDKLDEKGFSDVL